MSDDNIRRNIKILINETPKIQIKMAISILTDSIYDVISFDDFYKIDYDKYAQQIIDNSKLTSSKKDEIRKRFNKSSNVQQNNPPPPASSHSNQITQDQFSNSIKLIADKYDNPDKYAPAKMPTQNALTSFQTSMPDLVSSTAHIFNDLIEHPIEWKKNINCTICEQPTDENDRIYYSGYPYHMHCIKCMKCQKVFNSSNTINDFICVTKGLFLCSEHYNDYNSSQQLTTANYEEYHAQNKKNFVKELFQQPLLSTEIINNVDPDDDFITPNIIEDSIPMNLPYEDFIPTITFQFDKSPTEIDFEELERILGDDFVILKVERGCTFLKIAALKLKKVGQKIGEKCKSFANFIKGKLTSTLGRSVVGNIVKEPIITINDDQKIQQEYNKPSVNLLQNTYELSEIELEDIKEEVFNSLENEKKKKNWKFLFDHEQIFKQVEDQIRADIIKNDFEMIIVAQTVIANRNVEEFEKIKNKIPSNKRKVVFLYHGTKLKYHQSIVNEHFWMPGQDEMTHHLDSGFYGKGIYATENLFYASMYAKGYSLLNFNEKTHVFCCMAVYDTSNVGQCVDMSHSGQKINQNITSHYGINHAHVGSSAGFTPINPFSKDSNYLSAEEFVFPNKFQIIPVYSFTVMRKDHYILWKDEHMTNSENSNYLKDISKRMEVNVYSKSSVDEALEVIRKKKRNKVKLITNAGVNRTGKKLIEEARKIIGANFVCLVFASDCGHIEWVREMENVLFTTSPCDFKRFVEISLNKKEILKFAGEIESKYGYKVKINQKSLLSFPTTLKKFYTG